MNYFKWLYGDSKGSPVPVMDGRVRSLPEGESLEEHRKHCKAKKGNCPFEERADSVDEVEASRGRRKSGGSEIPEQAELARIYESEGVSKRLVQAAKSLHDGIISGAVKPKRLPASVFQDEAVAKIPKWMTYAYLVASNYPNDDKRASGVLEQFARASGKFREDLQTAYTEQYGDPIGHGMESDVYDDGKGYVMKSSTLGMDTKTTLGKIERIMLGNIQFPETGYKPIEMGKAPDGGLLFGLRQRWIPFDEGKKVSDTEIQKWLKERGWDLADPERHSYVSKGWDLACLDMHDDNLVRMKDGQILCIDPCVVPNTEAVGLFGYYDYENPPQEVS